MQVIKNPKLGLAENGNWYVEGAPGSIKIGDRIVQEIEERTEVRKANRLSKGGTVHYPAHSVLVGFISGVGHPFVKDSGEKVQRHYIDNAITRIM